MGVPHLAKLEIGEGDRGQEEVHTAGGRSRCGGATRHALHQSIGIHAMEVQRNQSGMERRCKDFNPHNMQDDASVLRT